MGHTVSGTVMPGLSGVYINTKTYSWNGGTLRRTRVMIKCVLSVWDKSDQISIDWKHGLEPRY